MTNLLAEIVVTLTLATNWTGIEFQGKELGYVATNHVATITYEGKQHIFPLKSVASDIAVWRPFQGTTVITMDSTTLLPSFTGTNIWKVE